MKHKSRWTEDDEQNRIEFKVNFIRSQMKEWDEIFVINIVICVRKSFFCFMKKKKYI